MEALILSCSTGGGHNSAAKAMVKELSSRGWKVTFFDPYTLRSDALANRVGNAYIRLVQLSPSLFGAVYEIGRLYMKGEKALDLPDPVLAVQKKTALALHSWLKKHPVDMVICSHPYPGLMLTWLKDHGYHVPPCMMIATDYTCIPFESDVMTDWMDIPHPDLLQSFHDEGISHSRMVACGIPIDPKFDLQIHRRQAAKLLHLDPDKRYILIGGGSMGIKGLWPTLLSLRSLLKEDPSLHILVLCGSNKTLYKRIEALHIPSISPVSFTRNMFEYLHLASLYITKPGGLSITEAAACGVPLLLTCPIPGCETKNAEFFEAHGYALYARKTSDIPAMARQLLNTSTDELREPLDPFFRGLAQRAGSWCEAAARLNATQRTERNVRPSKSSKAPSS